MSDRGQVVLLAAVVVAVALVSMTTAYHGLGYHGDVTATAAASTTDPVTVAERHLQRDVDAAGVGVGAPWATRTNETEAVRDRINASRAALRERGAREDVFYEVVENERVAASWADEDCPVGTMRAFGPCRADGGIVVQERANETVLVGVALDVTVRTATSETHARLRLVAH